MDAINDSQRVVTPPQLRRRAAARRHPTTLSLREESSSSALHNRRICPLDISGRQCCAIALIGMVVLLPFTSCLAVAAMGRPEPRRLTSKGGVCQGGRCVLVKRPADRGEKGLEFLAPHIKYCAPTSIPPTPFRSFPQMYQKIGLWPGLVSLSGEIACYQTVGKTPKCNQLEKVYLESVEHHPIDLTQLPQASGGYGRRWKIEGTPVVLEPGRVLYGNFGKAIKYIEQEILGAPNTFFSKPADQILLTLRKIHGRLMGHTAPSEYRNSGLILLAGDQSLDPEALKQTLAKVSRQTSYQRRLDGSLKALTATETDPGYRFKETTLSESVRHTWAKIGYIAPPPKEIATAMRSFVENWQRITTGTNPWVVSAYVRSELAKIAPFAEHNDVFARLIMQIPLLTSGNLPVIFSNPTVYWRKVQEDYKKPGTFTPYLCQQVRQEQQRNLAIGKQVILNNPEWAAHFA